MSVQVKSTLPLIVFSALIFDFNIPVEKGELPHNHEIMRQVSLANTKYSYAWSQMQMHIIDSCSVSPLACAGAWKVPARVLYTGLQSFYFCHATDVNWTLMTRFKLIVFLVQRCGSYGSAGICDEVCQ